MEELLLALYDCFYVPPEEAELQQEIEACHQTLIKTLSKAERRTLLKIIDNKDQIIETQSINSFIQGFLLASRLSTELSHYEAGLSVNRTREGGRMR